VAAFTRRDKLLDHQRKRHHADDRVWLGCSAENGYLDVGIYKENDGLGVQ
jgi:hypothetical protein